MFQTTNQHNFVLRVKHIQASHPALTVQAQSRGYIIYIYIYIIILYIYIYILVIYYIYLWMYIRLYIVIYVGYTWIIHQGFFSRTSCRHLGGPHHRYIPSHEPKFGSFNGSFLLSKNSMTIQRYAEVFLQA